MCTSLSWRTDSQLHDAVKRQLDEDPEIRAHDIAVTASHGVITLPDSSTPMRRQMRPSGQSSVSAASVPSPMTSR